MRPGPDGGGSTTGVFHGETVGTSGYKMACYQFLLPALTRPVTLAGTVQAVMLPGQDQTTADSFTEMVVALWDSTLTTRRGTLLAAASASENPTGTGSRILSGTLTSTDAQAGDVIVIEVGARFDNVTTSNRSLQWVAHQIAPDLSYANDLAKTAGRPWFEFSQDLPLTTKEQNAYQYANLNGGVGQVDTLVHYQYAHMNTMLAAPSSISLVKPQYGWGALPARGGTFTVLVNGNGYCYADLNATA
jgi:hypothetical protein